MEAKELTLAESEELFERHREQFNSLLRNNPWLLFHELADKKEGK